ncbi:glycosyltransferase [Butyrivibrio fibrisolvens]|uniref:glycosyltransferase n=1 Tax=Butyrivibrio fibrisolvens TaxID=831 RepID=UPI0003B762D6|nr:glycosyltransferase [Butyrivibrio fibrisolvens]
MKIIGIISLYNPVSEYCRNIQKVSTMVDLLILIDDSEKCHREIIEKVLYDNVKYIWNGNNYGLSKSINRGITIALENGAEWIFVMDQDSYPENDIIAIYSEYIKNNLNKDIALIAPQYNYDRRKRKAKEGTKNIKFANLSGSLINVEALNEIGLYNERFVIDGLDVEWCLRARKKEYRLVECCKAVLHHCPGETRYLSICGKHVWGYGFSTPDRHYYQIKAALEINSTYKDFRNIIMLVAKIMKALLLYENRPLYIDMTKKAFCDYKKHQDI